MSEAGDLLKAAQRAAKQVRAEQYAFSLRCRLGWHAWTNWRQIASGNKLNSDRQVCGFYSRHERHCKRCNHPQEKMVFST